METTVERGEVVYVSGNDLVVKMDDGQIRNFSDVPESARVTVGGQQLSIHDLKPGMKLERTITTTRVSSRNACSVREKAQYSGKRQSV